MSDSTLPRPERGILANFNLPRVRPWRELAVQAMMVMGLSWTVPWFRSLTQSTYALSPAYTFAVLWGMLLAAYLLMRALTHLELKIPLRRAALAALLVISVLIGLKTLLYTQESVSINDLVGRPLRSFSDAAALIPDEFIIILTILLVWRWGSSLAHEHIGPHIVIRTFQIGFLMFIAFVFINTFVTGESFGVMAQLFVFAGLMSMGASRVDTISTLRGGRENPFDRRWLMGLLLAVVGAVGIAAWLAAMFSGDDSFLSVLPRLFVGGFVAAALILATPLFLVATYALYGIVQGLDPDSALGSSLENLFQGMQGMLAGMADFMEKYLTILDPVMAFFARLAPWVKTLVLWGVVLLVGASIVLLLFVRSRRRQAQMAEENQSILRSGLLAMLRKSWETRLQEAARRLAEAADLRRRRRMLAAARIRRIYVRLMELCDELQHSRPEAQTPLEFLPTLASLFPAATTELAVITEAYTRIRYGELPETRQEVQQVEQAWKRVKKQAEMAKQHTH